MTLQLHSRPSLLWCGAESAAMPTAQGLISFEEVAVRFTAEEWALLDPGQKALCQEVMLEVYGIVASLGSRDEDRKSQRGLWPEATLLDIEEGTFRDQDGPGKQEGSPALGRRMKAVLSQDFDLLEIPVQQEHGKGKGKNMDPVHRESIRCKSDMKRHSKIPKGEKLAHLTFAEKIHTGEKAAHQDESKQEENQTEKGRNNADFHQSQDLSIIPLDPESVMGKREEKCLKCAKTFSSKCKLESHQRTHTVEKPYKCLDCGKSFTDRNTLNGHERTNTGEKLYKCMECGESFSMGDSLTKHLRIHTGEKPYKCLPCGKSFRQRSNLTNHRKSHTGDNPYKCLECEKSFSTKRNLIEHQSIHTGEKLYKCLECEKSFSNSNSLTLHQRIHTGEKPYKCTECGKSFCRRSSLTNHRRSHKGQPI